MTRGSVAFADLAVKDLFPTPIWTLDVRPDVMQEMNPRLLDAILALMTPRPALPPGANWQTDPILHRHPAFADFVKMVEQAGRSAAKFLRLKDTDLFVTGCWGNVNPPGGRNSPHTHPNNFLSGVYYVSLPGAASSLVLHDPRPQAFVMMPPVAEFSSHNGNTSTLEVKEGRMVLFPGWLTHSVPVNSTDQDRVSIAFNLMFRNYVENASPALWKGTVRVGR